MDTVSHCGGSAAGHYLSTLTITDVSTGWTEAAGLAGKLAEAVVDALETMQETLPFPVIGIDVDDGSEFINQTIADYCETNRIAFTRCRRYRKNDQCFVEEKARKTRLGKGKRNRGDKIKNEATICQGQVFN